MAHDGLKALAKVHLMLDSGNDENLFAHALEKHGFEVTFDDSTATHIDDTPHLEVVLTRDQTYQNHRNLPDKIDCIHILISDDLITEHAHFDFVVPDIPDLVPVQLRQIINLIEQKRLVEKERDTALDDVQRLEREISRKTRAVSEVEILKNAIVRNVSHELKTPLLQVKSAVALIAEDVKDEKLVSYAKDATARLETLVKNITLLGSSLDTNLTPVLVKESIEYARRNIRRIWEHRADSDRITIDVADGLPPVQADKQGLGTVLQLLMDNGLKFSQEKILVRAVQVGKNVQISVKDQGIGIPQKDLDAIFETFYQVDSSSTRRYGGTGVGLAIVQLILENHNAPIHVESVMGEGSTFMFELPVVQV